MLSLLQVMVVCTIIEPEGIANKENCLENVLGLIIHSK